MAKAEIVNEWLVGFSQAVNNVGVAQAAIEEEKARAEKLMKQSQTRQSALWESAVESVVTLAVTYMQTPSQIAKATGLSRSEVTTLLKRARAAAVESGLDTRGDAGVDSGE